jgi:hypothetical protein
VSQNWEEDDLEPRGGFVAAMNADGELVKIADVDEDGNVTPVGRAKTEPEDQPLPIAHDDQPFIHDTVANEVLARGRLGERRYGTRLQPFNGRRALQDAYEEVLDAAVYLRQEISEREGVVGAWCALDESVRSDIEDAAPDLAELLERLTGDVAAAARPAKS